MARTGALLRLLWGLPRPPRLLTGEGERARRGAVRPRLALSTMAAAGWLTAEQAGQSLPDVTLLGQNILAAGGGPHAHLGAIQTTEGKNDSSCMAFPSYPTANWPSSVWCIASPTLPWTAASV